MTFNLDRFHQLLTTQTLGRPLYWYEQVDSTNTKLWQLLADGSPPGTAVIAAQQTAGRGQWGRTWSSTLGGLYLSVAIAPEIPADWAPQITLCTAWGIAQQLRQQQLPIDLKWPNDLLLQGRKLGGILTETTLQSGQISQAVIGIGLNWCNPIPAPAISLQTYTPTPTPVIQATSCEPVNPLQSETIDPAIDSLEPLAAHLLCGIETGLHRWRTEGVEALLPSYVQLVTAWPIQQPAIQLSQTLMLSLANNSLPADRHPSDLPHHAFVTDPRNIKDC